MNGFNDKELQRIWDCLGLPADVSKQEEFERMVHEWRNADMEPKRIVRCRDCANFIEERGCCDYRKPFMFTVSPDGFCNNAKEKE